MQEVQEFIKQFSPTPEEEKVPRYWITSMIVTFIAVAGLVTFILTYSTGQLYRLTVGNLFGDLSLVALPVWLVWLTLL
jgi:hypothetical protein